MNEFCIYAKSLCLLRFSLPIRNRIVKRKFNLENGRPKILAPVYTLFTNTCTKTTLLFIYYTPHHLLYITQMWITFRRHINEYCNLRSTCIIQRLNDTVSLKFSTHKKIKREKKYITHNDNEEKKRKPFLFCYLMKRMNAKKSM